MVSASMDCRNDIGQPNLYDIYYGLADNRIGVASMTVPQQLPASPLPNADAANAIVPVVPQPVESKI